MVSRLSHMSKQHLAAYAASQPLLDAIILGKISTSRQGEKLARASDVVRIVHVHVPSATGPQAVEYHNEALDSIVAAWTNATEAYTEIFDSLAAITAPDPSLGREATRGHDDFRKMAETARMANKVASEWVSAVGGNSGGGRPPFEFEDKMDVDGEEVDEPPDPPGDDGASPEAETTLETPATGEKAAKKKEGLKQKRAKKRASHKEKIADLKAKKSDPARSNAKDAADDQASTNGGVKLPHVEYEDVSAEVEARLKAKEEKKQSKKAEKKRKRGSTDSVALLEETVQGAEKPRSKKARSSAVASEQGDAVPAETGKASKRKSLDIGVEVEEGRKKRTRKSK